MEALPDAERSSGGEAPSEAEIEPAPVGSAEPSGEEEDSTRAEVPVEADHEPAEAATVDSAKASEESSVADEKAPDEGEPVPKVGAEVPEAEERSADGSAPDETHSDSDQQPESEEQTDQARPDHTA